MTFHMRTHTNTGAVLSTHATCQTQSFGSQQSSSFPSDKLRSFSTFSFISSDMDFTREAGIQEKEEKKTRKDERVGAG